MSYRIRPLLAAGVGAATMGMGLGLAPGASAALTPTVTVTEYSPQVSGNIGESVANVAVSLTLVRDGETVASATAPTGAAGNWSASLLLPGSSSSLIGVTSNDTLDVSYSAPPGQTAPSQATYDFAGVSPEALAFQSSPEISADGSLVTADNFFACSAESVIVGSATATMSQAQGTNGLSVCSYSSVDDLTAADNVQVEVTQSVSDNGSTSTLDGISQAGLPGVSGGPPTCTADLVSDMVTCAQLAPGSYALTRGGQTPIDLSASATSGQASALVPDLAPGDVLTLTETAPTSSSRALTVLHVSSLRVDESGASGASTGTCAAGEPLAVVSDGQSSYPVPSACSLDGSLPGDAPGIAGETDDLSGGATIIAIPSLADEIPGWGASVPSTFTAYADWSGSGTVAQQLADVASVQLTITPRGGNNSPVVIRDLSLTDDSIGAYATTQVSGLAPGVYTADWRLTDDHGDTSNWSGAPFVVQAAMTGPTGQPGAAGATGAAGVAGPSGPAGRDGTSSELKCVAKTTGSGRHRRTTQSCRVVVLSPGSRAAEITLSRHGSIVARARVEVHSGVGRIRLHLGSSTRPGRYLLTVTTRRDGRMVTHRFPERIE